MGQPFLYFTSGAACLEVEIDCLTGDHQVIRTDIVMDLGASLNLAIDIGQIEGGFMQGYGLFTLEEIIYSPTGTVFREVLECTNYLYSLIFQENLMFLY